MFTNGIELQVFANEQGLGGNIHKVAISQQVLPNTWRKAGKWVLARQEGAELQVRHFDNGKLVKRCGSGNLALAAAWYLANSQYFEHTILSDSGRIAIGFDWQGPFYKERPLRQLPNMNRFLWSHLCAAPLQACASIGSQQEYCIAHLASECNINKIQLRSHALNLLSQRALILIAGHPPHPQMRYFAPQYGVAEDTATGSAAVQVARYFWHTEGSHKLLIRQETRDTAVIHTEYAPSQLATIRGRWHLKP